MHTYIYTLCSHENAKSSPKRMTDAATCDERPELRRDVAYRLHRWRMRAAAIDQNEQQKSQRRATASRNSCPALSAV